MLVNILATIYILVRNTIYFIWLNRVTLRLMFLVVFHLWNKYLCALVLPCQKAYSHFISNSNGNDPNNVLSEAEHIAFIYFWLVSKVFCSKPIQATSGFYNLAWFLTHSGKSIIVLAKFMYLTDKEVSSYLLKGADSGLYYLKNLKL